MHALSISGNPDKRNGHCRVSINLHLAVIASSRVALLVSSSPHSIVHALRSSVNWLLVQGTTANLQVSKLLIRPHYSKLLGPGPCVHICLGLWPARRLDTIPFIIATCLVVKVEPAVHFPCSLGSSLLFALTLDDLSTRACGLSGLVLPFHISFKVRLCCVQTMAGTDKHVIKQCPSCPSQHWLGPRLSNMWPSD